MVGPAAGQQREAQAGRDVGVLQLGPRQVAQNTPWDRVRARSCHRHGRARWRTARPTSSCLHDDPPELARRSSLTFLGMSINCAKCHNHPMEKWTNDQYYGMANLFARVRTKNGSGRRKLRRLHGDRGRPGAAADRQAAAAAPLDGEAVPFESTSRPPRASGRLAQRPREPVLRAARSPTASGPTSWASGWSKRSTTCG